MRFSILAWIKADIFGTKANCLIIPKGCSSQVWGHDDNGIEKSIFRLCYRLRLRSSKTCKRTLKISGWAFSTSSNKRTEYGLLRTFSVNFASLFFVAHISWRGSVEAAGREFFHVLTHIKTDEGRFIIKQNFRQSFWLALFFRHR